MPRTPPKQKFSLASAILAELETAERNDDRQEVEERESSSRSGLLFRGQPVEDELDGEGEVLELDEEDTAPVVEPPRLVSAEPRRAAPAPSKRTREDEPPVERAMLLGRARIGSPRVPDVGADVREVGADVPDVAAETIDLDSLMEATRASSRAPAASPALAWSYWPGEGDGGPAENDRRDRGRARRTILVRAGLGVAVLLALAGAFHAGMTFSNGRTAGSERAAHTDEPRAAETEGASERVAAPAVGAATSAPPAVTREAPPSRPAPEEGRPETAARAASAPAVGSTALAAAPETEGAAPAAAEDPALAEASAVAAEPGMAAAGEDGAPVPPAETSPEADPAPAIAAEASAVEVAPAAEPAPPSPAGPAVASGPLPTLPSRADIRRALSGVTPALRSCTEHRGTAMMSITIAGSGELLSATPSGPWAASADRGCIREAVGNAHLPRFRQDRLTLQFPFVL